MVFFSFFLFFRVRGASGPGLGAISFFFALGGTRTLMMGAACVRVGDRFLFVWVLAQ